MMKSIMSGFMKKSVRALAFVSILAGFSACASASTVWNLVGVTFSDGAAATGFFTVNSTFDALTNWDVTIAGSSLGADFHYTPADSNFFNISPTEVALGSNPFASFMVLIPVAAMTNAGGTINLTTGDSSVDCSPTGACGALVGGQISTASIPEPSSVGLAASGACILGLILYRRRRALSA